ncbi:6-bladed beta-propeller [Algoriphagus sp.]|uniref:6-bladed beta-propeller n=2 Tax=Algoriphagus sp. TaxID=1872435 RepID=UPI00329827D9
MRTVFNYLQFIIVFFLLYSCENKNQTIAVDVNLDLDIVKEGKFSDIFDSIQYVLLNDTESQPLVQPYKIKFLDSLIFVEDQELDNLFIFNEHGNLKNVIFSKGVGPEEFYQLQDFQLSNGIITIMDIVSGKLINFNYNGNFISERRLLKTSSNFVQDSTFDLFFFNNRPPDSSYNFLYSDGSVNRYNMPINSNYDGISLTHLNGFMYESRNNDYYIDIPFSYQVAKFSGIGNLVKVIEFNFGKYSITDDERLEMIINRNLYNLPSNKIGMLDSFYPIGSIFSVCFSNSNDSFIYLLDDKLNKLYSGKNLENDIDGLNIFKMLPWTYYSDGIVFKFPAYVILNLISKNSFKNSDKSNLESFYEENKEALQEDLSVLVKIKLKNKFL